MQSLGTEHMGHLAVWKTLEEMVADFRRRGKEIPAEVMKDLKSARTMIRIAEADPNSAETNQKIEQYLANVESYLVSEGQKQFGAEYVDNWFKRLREAAGRVPAAEEGEGRFALGAPRGQKWIRVRPSTEFTLERLRILAEESGVSCKPQSGEHVLISGKDEQVKRFIKKMASEYALKTEK